MERELILRPAQNNWKVKLVCRIDMAVDFYVGMDRSKRDMENLFNIFCAKISVLKAKLNC